MREEQKKNLKAMKHEAKKESQYIEEKPGHTVIDIGECDYDETQHLLAHDLLAQSINPYDDFNGSEMPVKIPRVHPHYMSQAKIEISESSNASGSGVASAMRSHAYHQSVDKSVKFGLFDNSSKNSVDTSPIQLNSTYPAVKSCVDVKGDARSTNQTLVTNIGSMGSSKMIQSSNISQVSSVSLSFIITTETCCIKNLKTIKFGCNLKLNWKITM